MKPTDTQSPTQATQEGELPKASRNLEESEDHRPSGLEQADLGSEVSEEERQAREDELSEKGTGY